MNCDICKKNEATVHLTEIVNDKVTKLHLCEQCAREKSEEMESHFGLSDLLAGLAEFGEPQELKVQKTMKCAACGFTFFDFQRIGRLGCPQCYETFDEQLSPLLKRIHGSDRHMGKIPFKGDKTSKMSDDAKELQALKVKLQKAINSEAFEQAAVLRDQIREIEGRLRSNGTNPE